MTGKGTEPYGKSVDQGRVDSEFSLVGRIYLFQDTGKPCQWWRQGQKERVQSEPHRKEVVDSVNVRQKKKGNKRQISDREDELDLTTQRSSSLEWVVGLIMDQVSVTSYL